MKELSTRAKWLMIGEVTARSEAGRASEKTGKWIWAQDNNMVKVKGGWGQLKQRFVGARCDEVVSLAAVEAESFVSTAFFFLSGERTAADRIDLHGHNIQVVRIEGSLDVGVNEVV